MNTIYSGGLPRDGLFRQSQQVVCVSLPVEWLGFPNGYATVLAINKGTAVSHTVLVDAINDIIVSNKEMDATGPQPLSKDEKQNRYED